jgi:8-oxo-dGTP pyrophosphatase MutT (NUDIX family)
MAATTGITSGLMAWRWIRRVLKRWSVMRTEDQLLQLAALPWRRENDGSLSVMMITSRSSGKWMLPKGWPMVGKSDPEAAAQEAFEEAGVSGEISNEALGEYSFRKLLDDDLDRPARAIVYSLRVTEEHDNWPEKGQRRRNWFPLSEAAAMAAEADLARFLKDVAAGRIALI